ncbi:MAG: zinc carboxypeptidase, partial [Cyclobacteriaceae bacterium]
IKVYQLARDQTVDGKQFKAGKAYIVPTRQPQYRMVQSAFETYEEYTDSVYYDASAWSLVNFYNLPYAATTVDASGKEITSVVSKSSTPERSGYAYILPWTDYNAPGALYALQSAGVITTSAFKPFSNSGGSFGYGTVVIPVGRQLISKDSLYNTIKNVADQWKVTFKSVETGYSTTGIDLGSGNLRVLQKPKAIMLVGEGVNSYEQGEVWHLLDTRVRMPVTKLPIRNFARADLFKYNVMVLVSGSYSQLDSVAIESIKTWLKAGNTLVTTRTASRWAIKKGLAKEELIKEEKDSATNVRRLNYVDAREYIGRKQVGGAIFEVDLDITHPLGFGYTRRTLPVYRNSNVWLKPSKNPYSTVAKYTEDPHIDGFITRENLETYLKPSASLLVSKTGRGRVVLFADNPNFRGSWYGTNKLFLNALFLGQHITVPE